MPLIDAPTGGQIFGEADQVTPKSTFGSLIPAPTGGNIFAPETKEPITTGTEYHDYANALWSGMHAGIGAPVMSLLARGTGSPQLRDYFMAHAADYRRQASEDIQSMSPAGQEAMQPSLFSSEFWTGHPLRNIALQVTQQAPSAAAMIGVGAIGGAIGGPLGASGAGGSIYALQNAGSAMSDFAETINQLPDSELQKNPDYAKLRVYMPEADAKRVYINTKSGALGEEAAAIGAVSGLAPELGSMVRGAAAKGLTGLALRGGITGTSFGLGSGATEAVTEQAAGQAPDIGRIKSSATTGALTGFAFGATTRPQHGTVRTATNVSDDIRPVDEARPNTVGSRTETPKPDDVTQGETIGGVNTQKGSATRYPKEGLGQYQGGKPPAKEPTGGVTVSASTPSSPVGEAESLALTPKSKGETDKPPKPNVQPQPVKGPEPAEPPQPRPATPVASPPAEAVDRPPEPRPGPTVAARDIAAQSVTEPRSTLDLQKQSVLNNTREMMVYPRGDGFTPLSKDEKANGLRSIKYKDDIYVYNKDGPSKLTYNDTLKKIAKGDVNDLLGYGPVTKEEAVARTAQGETPLVVTERTPDGIEVKAAAGTDQTVERQVPALEKTKAAPENTIQVEKPEQTIGERFKAKQAELREQQKARILPDMSTEGKRAEAVAAQTQADLEKRRAQEEALKAKQEAGPQPGHRTKAELAARDKDNVTADAIMARHVPKGGETRPQIYGRAQDIVREADKAGIKVPTEISDKHSPGMMLLAEAKQLTSVPYPKLPAYGRYLEREGLLHQNLAQEAREARKAEGEVGLGFVGQEEPVHEEAPSEQEDRLVEQIDAQRQAEQQYTAGHMASGFQVQKTKTRESTTVAERLRAARAQANVKPTDAQKEAGNYAKGHINLGGRRLSIETPAGAERRGVTLEGKEWESPPSPSDYGYIRGTTGADGDHVDVHVNPELDHPIGPNDKIFIINQRDPHSGQFDEHKVFVGYDNPQKVISVYGAGFNEHSSITNNRLGGIVEMTHDEFKDWLEYGDKGQPIYDGPAGQRLDGMVTTPGKGGKLAEFRPQSRSTIKESLTDFSHVEDWQKIKLAMAKIIAARVNDIVGDVPVYYVTGQQMHDISGHDYGGYYSPAFNHIVMNVDWVGAKHALLHESIHAATVYGMQGNRELINNVHELMSEVNTEYVTRGKNIGSVYGFTNAKEFIAEALSNPKFQGYLDDVKISSRLAKILGMPEWKQTSVWSALVNVIRKFLNIPPHAYTALEAAMRLGEEATWAHDPLELARQVLQKQDMVNPTSTRGEAPEFRNHYIQQALDDPEDYSREYEKGVLGVTSKLASSLKSSSVNISAEFARKGRKILSATQIYDVDGHLFGGANGPFRKLINAREKVGNLFQKIAEPGKDLVREGALLQKRHDGPVWRQYGMVKSLANTFQVDPTAAPPKYSISNMQAFANYDKVVSEYNKLPEDLKNYFNDEMNYYRDRQDELRELRLRKTLEPFEPPTHLTRDEVVDKILNGKLTPEEKKHYEDLGLLGAIRQAKEFSRQAIYFPAHREGDFVVEGKHEIPAGGSTVDLNGEALPEGVREFPDEQSAYAFVKDLELPATVRSLPGQKEVRVTVENRHLELANTMSEAREQRQAMLDSGIKNVSGVQDLKNRDVADSFTSIHAKALIDKINARKDLTQSQKDLYAEEIHKTAIANLTGNRIQKYWLQRQNVQGADFETVNALEDYNNASSAYLARGQHQAEIDAALEGMDEIRKAGKDGPDSFRLGVVYNEMAGRTQGFDYRNLSPRVSPLVQKMMTINFLRFLASPAHIVLHMIHPLLYSLPTLAGRHGYPVSYRAYAKALGDIGGIAPTLGLGFKSAGHILGAPYVKEMGKAMDWARGANFLETLTGGSGINSREKGMFNDLTETGHIHPNNGFTADTYRSVDLDRVNRAAREITGAAEAINRTATALAAYRLEYNKTLDHGSAINYAREILEKSQGLFSATNSAPFTRIPWLRPFLQFRQFPMQIAWILGRSFHNIFKGESPEIKTEALKTFSGIMGTAALLSGVNGMPTEVLKVPAALGNALGVTYSPEEYDDKFHRWVVEHAGKTLGNMIMDGLPSLAGPLAPDIHHRAGLSSLFTFGQPASGKPDDLTTWITNTILGTPGSLMTDTLRGINAMSAGNWNDAIKYFAPAKIIADAARAYKETEKGNVTARGRQVSPPLSAASGLLQVFGFQPQEWAREQAGRSALYEATQRTRTEKQNILDQMTKGDRGSALKALHDWNLKHPQDRITPAQLENSIKDRKAPSALGMKITPKSKALIDEYEGVYGR